MPRKPRITIPGCYHIVNRGVNRERVLPTTEDKEKFLELLDLSRGIYQFTVHAFCLLDNHYHLLIETSRDNLSLAIRYINSRYAEYYNAKTNRVGPLWQGRYKSWFVHDEQYFWLLLRYIEMNPVKAGLVDHIGDYPYASAWFVIHSNNTNILTGSSLYKKDLCAWLVPLDETSLDRLKQFENQRLERCGQNVKSVESRVLGEYFRSGSGDIEKRNTAIYQAFMDGFHQSSIADHLSLSTAAICRIIDVEREKRLLFKKIRDEGLLWSYAAEIEYSHDKNGLLIETILKYGDLVDIHTLFALFGKREIMRIWQDRMKPDTRFKKLNYFIARTFLKMNVEAGDFTEVPSVRAEKLRLLAGQHQEPSMPAH